MKRILTFALFAVLVILPTQAASPTSGVFALSRYAPDYSELFITLRTDDEFLGVMDALEDKLRAVVSELGGDASTIPDFQQIIGSFFNATTDEQIANVFQWTGDTMALSIGPGTAFEPSSIMAIVPVTDVAGAQRFLDGQFTANVNVVSLGTMGRFQVWDDSANAYILLASDIIILVGNITRDELDSLTAETNPRLSDVAQYISAVDALPEAEYSIGVYVSGEAFTDPTLRQAMTGSSLAVGATVMDDSTYVFDAALVPPTPLVQPLAVNPDFVQFIPSNMGVVLHGADFAAQLGVVLDIISESIGQDAEGIVRIAFGSLGLNYDEFRSWTKGDFALFGRFDVRPILPSVMGTPPSLRGLPSTLDVALLLEAVHTARAQAFASYVASLIRDTLALGEVPTMSAASETINGTNVLILANEQLIAPGTTLALELGMGASDEVFALGTANAIRSLFRGDALSTTRTDSSTAVERYLLPGSSLQVLLDGVTVANIGITSTVLAVPQQQRPEALDTADEVSRVITRLATFFRQGTLSVAVTDAGVLLARATLTLGD